MMKGNKWSSRIKQAVVNSIVIGGLAALVSIVSGCLGNKLIDKALITKPYVETTFLSGDFRKAGERLAGQSRRDFVRIDLNDRLLAFVWQNYVQSKNEFNERDFGLSYTLPITKQVSASFGYAYWSYPSGTLGKHDNALMGELKYKGDVSLDFEVTQVIGHDKIPSGTRYYLKAFKSLSIGKIRNIDLSLTPSISAAFVDNWYGSTGNSQITHGISLGLQKEKFGVNFFLNSQDGKIAGRKDDVWYGLSLGYKF